MAEDLKVVAAQLVVRLREAEKLALEGKTSEARAILKDVVKTAREKGLERSLRNLVLRVKALTRRKTRR